MAEYRVRAVAPDKYIVERKTWRGWVCALRKYYLEHWEPVFFDDPKTAQEAVYTEIEEQSVVSRHVSQEPWYFTARAI